MPNVSTTQLETYIDAIKDLMTEVGHTPVSVEPHVSDSQKCVITCESSACSATGHVAWRLESMNGGIMWKFVSMSLHGVHVAEPVEE